MTTWSAFNVKKKLKQKQTLCIKFSIEKSQMAKKAQTVLIFLEGRNLGTTFFLNIHFTVLVLIKAKMLLGHFVYRPNRWPSGFRFRLSNKKYIHIPNHHSVLKTGVTPADPIRIKSEVRGAVRARRLVPVYSSSLVCLITKSCRLSKSRPPWCSSPCSPALKMISVG